MTDSIHKLFFLDVSFLFLSFFFLSFIRMFTLDELYTSVSVCGSVIYCPILRFDIIDGGQCHSGGSCGRCVAVPCIDMGPTPDRRTFQHAVDSQLGRSRTDRGGGLAVAVVIAVNCKWKTQHWRGRVWGVEREIVEKRREERRE